jgi:hypothetical protein
MLKIRFGFTASRLSSEQARSSPQALMSATAVRKRCARSPLGEHVNSTFRYKSCATPTSVKQTRRRHVAIKPNKCFNPQQDADLFSIPEFFWDSKKIFRNSLTTIEYALIILIK